ncbi:MAG: YciI family protein [Candidatus Zixiibacteriota bacterium]
MKKIFIYTLTLAFIIMPFANADDDITTEETMPEYKQYLVRLLGTRDGWPEDMTKDEEKIMEKHFYFLKDLVKKKIVLMAGPVFDFKFGLIVFQVESEERIKEIMKDEPSVVAGIHTWDFSEMRVSLMAEK